MASEKRLIDANAITYRMISYGGWGGPPDYVTDKDFIDEMPTVDAGEVVHGHWIWCGADRWNDAYACSVCGKMAMDDGNYCPNCGAKMDGDGNG